MSVAVEVPARGPLFEGHFPDRPILPGIAQLALLATALRPGAAATIAEIPFVRFRGVVLPGNRLAVAAEEREDGVTRFSVRRGADLVTHGALRFGSPAVPDDVSTSVAARRAADIPSLDALIPHRAPMRFAEKVLGEAEDGLSCLARIPGACALARGGSAPAYVALEAAAQAAAIWEALRRARGGGASEPRIGYLVTIRDTVLHRAEVPADAGLLVSIRLDGAAGALADYAAEVAVEGTILLRGTIGTYAAGQSSPNTNH